MAFPTRAEPRVAVEPHDDERDGDDQVDARLIRELYGRLRRFAAVVAPSA